MSFLQNTNVTLNKQIVFAYTQENASMKHIMERLHCGFFRIKDALAESQTLTRRSGGQCRCTIDESFFETIDSEEKAYWVGFILADGSIRHCNGSWRLTVELQFRDIEHLRKLQLAVSSNHKLTTHRGCVMFSVCSEKLCKSLITLDITPKKMYTATPAKVPVQLRHHYFRGLIDGDGSISRNCNRLGYDLRLFGTKAVLSDFSHWLGLSGNNVRKKKNQAGYEFGVRDQKRVVNALETLYGDATVYLDRKYDRYQDAVTRWYSMPHYRYVNRVDNGQFRWTTEPKQLPLPF